MSKTRNSYEETAATMLHAFRELLAKFPASKKSDVCSALMMASYNALRQLEGDEFVLGYLESAVRDLKQSAPLQIMPEVH